MHYSTYDFLVFNSIFKSNIEVLMTNYIINCLINHSNSHTNVYIFIVGFIKREGVLQPAEI